MGNDPHDKSLPQTLFKFTWVVVVIVGLVVASIFYSRHEENQAIEEKAARAERERARRLAEGLGGSNFEIMNFYAAPGAIHRGDSSQICYGVSNAKDVMLTPKPSEGVWPSPERCVSVSPEKTTTYTLTITNSSGEKKTATLVLTVQ
ncbi:MAG TPA: hypothetical protein VGR81_13115 [Candidatus Acidoferrales bacterium]|nr:hypothetical protein [Candidatus Acidoferrales bacterium]